LKGHDLEIVLSVYERQYRERKKEVHFQREVDELSEKSMGEKKFCLC